MRLSRCVRPLVSAVLVMSFALAAMLTTTQPARATSSLAVWIDCEGTGGASPFSTFFCRASASGGTGIYSYSWSGDSTAWPDPTNEWITTGTCQTGMYSQVTVTVTDSASNTGSESDYFVCYEIVP